ncbi:MAG: hypothetical protein SAJ12_13860 [Jaaginema sp. PMC 1079.18]|nr:hypothetical protein [Jaaginema sp. PMC 1080.18]MEC4852067.1 hypothetical protein [Jaaginema sp. PMC 1079.18]MEC4866464.1 hypothetical protein [Jaaginema sp. PMC 1078.18]
MTKSIRYHPKLIESLKDPTEAAMYLEVVLEEGDPQMIRKAFLNVIEAREELINQSPDFQGQLSKFERKLQDSGEIEFTLLQSLLNALGLKIGLMVN